MATEMKLFGFIAPVEATEMVVRWSGEWPCNLYDGAKPNTWEVSAQKQRYRGRDIWCTHGYNGGGHAMSGGAHETKDEALASAQSLANELLDARGLIRAAYKAGAL